VPAGLGGVVTLNGIVLLPSPRRTRVVAMGVDDPDALFATLFEHVISGLERAGAIEREKRPFLPHLTIARLREPVALQPKSEGENGPFSIESVCLYKSELRPEGARYVVLERRVLARAALSL
jgi:2'-5' RNA ligase